MRSYPRSLNKYSNPRIAQKKAITYLGKKARLYPATRRHKKYKIYNPINKTWVHFGQLGYEDFTKHKDKQRRKNYLTRTKSIQGAWKNNPYSPNNLSRKILW